MSGLSVTPYFPFRRVVMTHQSVEQEIEFSWFEARPNQRFAPVCSTCGERIERIHRWEKRPIRDLNLASHQVWIGCRYRKGHCKRCERVRVEDLEFVEPYQRVTRRLATHVLELCRRGLTVYEVADHLALNWKTVKRIEQTYLEEEYGQTDYSNLSVLAVDEIAIRKGHRYLTVVLDYQTGRVVWMGQERTAEALESFFAGMTDEQRTAISAVAMDMWDPYIKAVREAVPQAKIVFDFFHVVQAFNRVIDQVRNTEYKKAEHEEKEVLKGSKYVLLKKTLKKQKEREHLKELLTLNEAIFTVMVLRDMLPRIWKYRYRAWARRRLNEWCALARTMDHPGVRQFANQLERHAYGILNHCNHPIHTSRLEGVNNKIKVIKRTAYGFHDDRYFSLKVIQAFDPQYRRSRSPTAN